MPTYAELQAQEEDILRRQNNAKNWSTGLSTAGTAAQLIPGVGTAIGGALMAAGAITGAVGSSKAKKELEELQNSKVNITTPASIEKYVESPVSEEYLQQIADQASQRVGTTVGALQKGGIMGMQKLPMLMQNEARNDAALQADLAERSKQALLTGGQYEARNQDAARRDWELDTAGTQVKRAEGQKYLWNSLNELGRLGMATYWNSLNSNKINGGSDNNGYSPTSVNFSNQIPLVDFNEGNIG